VTHDDQRATDTFYWRQGPCCAGCDWWHHLNTRVGLCTRAAPVAAAERTAMLGIERASMHTGAGHPFTPREHRCGDFRDEFDWTALPLAYRRSVGCLA
jgi:hypothetical protein